MAEKSWFQLLLENPGSQPNLEAVDMIPVAERWTPPEVIESSPARAPFVVPPKPDPIRRVTTTSGRYGPTRIVEVEPLLWSPFPPLENLMAVFPASRREEIRSAVKSNPKGTGILTAMYLRALDRYEALEMLGLDPWAGWVADEPETVEETAA